MSYLNNQVLTLDAILTVKGRECLAKNDGSFKITQFALADDEIDYTLYNPNHPSGSAYFGEAIENLPILEASPDETQVMKYKLITLPRGTGRIPVLDLGYQAITLKQGSTLAVTPQTLNYLGGNNYEASGYSFTISDIRTLNTFVATGGNTQNTSDSILDTLGTNVSKTVIGSSLTMTATTINTLFGTRDKLQATLTVTGLDSGARHTIPVTITKTV